MSPHFVYRNRRKSQFYKQVLIDLAKMLSLMPMQKAEGIVV